MAKKPKPPKGIVKVKRQLSAKELANLKPAKKGEVRNPTGINANPLVLAFRAAQEDKIRKYLGEVLESTPDELDQMCEREMVGQSTRLLVARCMRKAIDDCNFDFLRQLIEQVFGKLPDKLDLTAKTKATSVDRDVLKAALTELKDEF